MQTIKLRTHSIILLVAPSNAGKDYFINNHLQPQLHTLPKINSSVLSTDDIRRELLGNYSLHKYEQQMNIVSSACFQQLYSRLDAYTSFPVNHEFVIVNSTGLSEDFRHKVRDIARKNNYNLHVIMFDFKDRKDYEANIETIPNHLQYKAKETIHRHIKTFREKCLREVTKKNYTRVDYIRNRRFDEIKFEVEDLELYQSCFLDDETPYLVVNDPHECTSTLKTLLAKNDEKDADFKAEVIVNGDYIDKGNDLINMIDFMYENRTKFKFTHGNHENYVYRHFTEPEGTNEIGSEIQYFSSIPILEKNPETLAKFLEIHKLAKPFYRNSFFYVNHAPCEVKYLGKMDDHSKRMQRNVKYPKTDNRDDIENYLHYLKDGDISHPFVVNGHIPFEDVIVMKNRILNDTGCVYGNKLTGVRLFKHNRPIYYKIHSEYTDIRDTKKLIMIFDKKEPSINDVELDGLDGNDFKAIYRAVTNKVNFISSTMCPVNNMKGELENIEYAIQHYTNRKVERIILQKKYMGSRCQIYLFNPSMRENNYATSRGGHKIRLDLNSVYDTLYKRFDEAFFADKEMVILDGELLPWSAIGAGLIDNSFRSIGKAISSEYELLKSSGFYDKYNQVAATYQESGYVSTNKSRKQLVEEYGQNNFRLFNGFENFNYTNPESEKQYVDTYNEQVELFGAMGEVYYNPFSMLKKVFSDGTEEIMMSETHSNIDIYRMVSDDEAVVIELNDYDSAVEEARKFFDYVTNHLGLEGLVIKPEFVYTKDVAPYFKCRNEKYLSIIYGYDYQKHYSEMVDSKNIRRKLETSQIEFYLSKLLLETPYKDINRDNKDHIKKLALILAEINNESSIDSRL